MKLSLSKVFLVTTIMFFASCYSQNKDTEMSTDNRKAAVAGRFYPSDPKEISSTLKELFSKAKSKEVDSEVLAILSPHASHIVSGEVAASSYNQIDINKSYKAIFVIGSSHRTYFSGASIYSKGHYITPLGTVKVDIDLAQKLIDENDFLHFYKDVHMFEHSLEVQLPFLQYIMKKDFSIVPIVIGSKEEQTPKQLAKALEPYFTKEYLFIISTDFSHYPKYDDAYAADKVTADAMCTNSPQNLITAINKNSKSGYEGLSTSICGLTAALTLLYITEDKQVEYKQIQYMNSGDTPYGEPNSVVGYHAIVVVEGDGNKEKTEKQDPEEEESSNFSLSDEEKKSLLTLARTTINDYIKEGEKATLNANDFTDNLSKHCGAFVTLHKKGDLRGCIGRFEPNIPLYKVVQNMAIASATRDFRFSTVTEDEIDELDIEISVLTPMKKIESIDEIELGRHGIYIKKGITGGTFLPQVATDTKWTKEEFLGHCARDKARIGWDGWKNADIYIYEALVFSEKEFSDK